MTDKQVLELYDKHYNTVYRVALSYTHSVQDAEDITQDVFLKLIEKHPKVSPDKERAWLIRITINKCKDLHKSCWKQKCDFISDEGDFIVPGLFQEESDLFYALGRLPDKYRIVVHLHYYEGYSFKEISGILRIPVSTVSMRMHRSREMLKKILLKEEII